MEDKRVIITVTGIDKVGIIAAFANALAKYNVNIEDVRQSIMQGNFVMIMMADYSKAVCSFQEFKQGLLNLGEEMDMEIWVQRKKIVDKMHTI